MREKGRGDSTREVFRERTRKELNLPPLNLKMGKGESQKPRNEGGLAGKHPTGKSPQKREQIADILILA